MDQYNIGSNKCPGLSKLIEESGEVQQVVGKIIGIGHMGEHWDGSNLRERFTEELADLLAAIDFVAQLNNLDTNSMADRRIDKFDTFMSWHKEQKK